VAEALVGVALQAGVATAVKEGTGTMLVVLEVALRGTELGLAKVAVYAVLPMRAGRPGATAVTVGAIAEVAMAPSVAISSTPIESYAMRLRRWRRKSGGATSLWMSRRKWSSTPSGFLIA
jgi:hypothetical protein